MAKKNHKAVGVERYQKFLNHSQRISTEDRGTSESFVEIGMATAYAWNASPIDGTDIVRSVPAIGRELRFPLDISLADIPTPIDKPRRERDSLLTLHTTRCAVFSKDPCLFSRGPALNS